MTVGGLAILASRPAIARKRRRQTVDISPFEMIGEKMLGHLRETATYNGTAAALDGGPLARALDDYSPSGETAQRAEYRAGLDLLARIRVRGDSPEATALGTISAILNNGARSAGIPYGRINPLTFTGHTPYLISQISGPHIDSLNIMMEQQSLSTAGAVDAWLEKLDALPIAFAGVIEKLRFDASVGCVPPRALIEKTIPIIDSFLMGKAGDQPLIRALARRTSEAGLSKRIMAMASRRGTVLLQRRARPAFAALRTALNEQLKTGRLEAGIWAQPQGDTLYAANVAGLGDTELHPEEIHRIGLDEVTRIAAQMNKLLAKQGMPIGSIGERMATLAFDQGNQFSDSDAGREALLAFVREKIGEAEALYPRILPAELVPRQSLIVKRVPLATQDSAPGGFYDGPSLDGRRPGTYWINLRDMGAVPRFMLPTLSYHEGVPGHHTQGSIAASLPGVPLLVRVASFNAYQEGWGLYAEQLMSELGVYENDPLGDLGRLQDELFRAVRLVIDTGLHHKRWTREAAIRTMKDITGVPESRVVAEVERYMAWPGQALGYKLGHLRLLKMREKWLAARGNTLPEFHRRVLADGPTTLAQIEARLF